MILIKYFDMPKTSALLYALAWKAATMILVTESCEFKLLSVI
jgi:hypothetical protein